jgi:maltose alpha-D-glucosyltransferase / alpha-amylase
MSIYPSPGKSFMEALQTHLPSLLPDFLMQQRWFGGKARVIQSVQISDIVPLDTIAYLILAMIHYASGASDTYAIPLVRASAETGPLCLRIRPNNSAEEIFLEDALTDEKFLSLLLDLVARNASLPGTNGQIRAVSASALSSFLLPDLRPLKASVMRAEQSNSSIVYESRLVLKLFRRVAEGLNPDLEIGAFLTEKTSFRNVPPLAGYLEYWSEAGARTSLGVLQGYIANQGDAWQFTLRALADYYGEALRGARPGDSPQAPLLNLLTETIPNEARQRIGAYLDSAALLGQRTAELHLALGSATEDPDFTPAPFSEAERQAFADSAVELLTANFDLLRRLKERMPDHARDEAESVLKLEETARRRLQLSAGLKSSAMVTRIHGDYHLGQVLYTGSDFVIIDFEGEPARPLEERRKKRSPLQDVAGMLRSFHYAAYAPLLQQERGKNLSQEEMHILGEWAQYWQKWVSATFLRTYLDVAGNAIFIPKVREELSLLLDAYLLDKAVYELGYELNNRPTWIRIPLDGISQLLYPDPQF